MYKRIILFITGAMIHIMAAGQSRSTLQVREYRAQHESAIMQEYISLLSVPNIAADTPHLRENAAMIMEMMKKRGIKQVQLLSPATPGAPPAVYGESLVPGAAKTIMFYAHYDGQPVRVSEWAAGLDPFRPQLVDGIIGQGGKFISFPGTGTPWKPDWRIYARGASDDKAGVMAILNAYEALVKTGAAFSCNLKFFIEGEEEAGSPHLQEILQRYSGLLQSDLWIFCDGPSHPSGRKQLVFGVRGMTHLDLTVYASKRPLHSGHYGNWAPNPAMMLVKLLASMKDDRGRVTIKGFYDDTKPMTDDEKKAYREIPSTDEQLKTELGISATEMKGKSLVESLRFPALNINGIQSGNVGKLATNVIPVTATCVLDLRMAPGDDWRRQQQKVIGHIRSQGYYVTAKEPTDEERKKYEKIIKVIPDSAGYNAQQTPLSLPLAQSVIEAVKSTTPDPLVLLPGEGGSLPLFLFEEFLHAKTIIVTFVNYDNNQHAANENLRVGNFWEGIETLAAIMLIK